MAMDGELIRRWWVEKDCHCIECSPGLYVHCGGCREVLYRYAFHPHYCNGLFADRLPGYVKQSTYFPRCTHPERSQS